MKGEIKKTLQKHCYPAEENPEENSSFKIIYIYIGIWKKKITMDLHYSSSTPSPRLKRSKS